MQIKYRKSSYHIEKGITLLDFIFSINRNINKNFFCQEGNCKNCYAIIMEQGTYQTREILACQTKINYPIRIVALSKNLKN